MAISGNGIFENVIGSLQKCGEVLENFTRHLKGLENSLQRCDEVVEKVTRRLEDLENSVAGLHASRQEGCDFAALLDTLKTATSAFTKLSTQIASNSHAVSYAPSVSTNVADPVHEVATTADQPKASVEHPSSFILENEDDEESYLDYTGPKVSPSPDEELPHTRVFPPLSNVIQQMSQPHTAAFVNEVKTKNPSVHDSTPEAETEKKSEKPFVDDSTPEAEIEQKSKKPVDESIEIKTKLAFEDEPSVEEPIKNAPRSRFYPKPKVQPVEDLNSSVPVLKTAVKDDDKIVFKADCKLYNLSKTTASVIGSGNLSLFSSSKASHGVMWKDGGDVALRFSITQSVKVMPKANCPEAVVISCTDCSKDVPKDGNFIARFKKVEDQEEFCKCFNGLPKTE